jgi:8-oxo-dGTP diphosphatase
MELWDVFDRSREKTGRTAVRGQHLAPGEYHLVVHVWIRNSAGKFLISKRQPTKRPHPGMWEPTVGSAILGDDSLAAALREAKEELGLCLSPTRGRCLLRFSVDAEDASAHVDVWLFEEDVDLAKVTCQPDEVAAAKWATPEEIRGMVAHGEFVLKPDYLDQLLAMCKQDHPHCTTRATDAHG